MDFTSDCKQAFSAYANFTLTGLVKGISYGQFSFTPGAAGCSTVDVPTSPRPALSGSLGASYVSDTIKSDADMIYGGGLRKDDFSTGSLPPHDQSMPCLPYF